MRLEQILSQKQILAPQQILQASLLQLNTINLEQKILDELESNPVLEQAEPKEVKEEEDSAENGEMDRNVDSPDDFDEYEPPNVYYKTEETYDAPLVERVDFIELLVKQLNDTNLNEEEKRIGEEILWNLDDRGYLATELILIADRFGKEKSEIEPILNEVQHLDPLGIAARDLRECLLIQLDTDTGSPAHRVVKFHFEDFANKRYEVVQAKSGLTEEELSDAITEISQLNPRPGEAASLTKDGIVIPDVVVREQNGEFVIQINDGGLPELRINNDYLSMMDAKAGFPTDARSYLRKKIDAGHWFIQAIEQRRQTMTAVTKTIIERQREFFMGNLQHLNPMKLQDIADEIKMDISTISRSTRGKYVDTIYGIFELKTFFTEGMAKDDGSMVSTNEIKQALKVIIDNEDKSKPLNDEKLAKVLNDKGYPVARRTVAKYREQLQQPVARLRRQLNR
ncbi:MAG: RNA polymerase factor sigma-54 [Candidatus Marinimicrobia bacterium]|nr:RNA polymerase factor sigma-54 [Candidatus Neomarinimicrobiota bacterium]